MNTSVDKLRRIVETLQEIIDTADDRGATTIVTSCNTYGLRQFISLGSDGFLNLNANIDDLIEDPECDDDVE